MGLELPDPNLFLPYRAVRELARGGMGVVYEAVHVDTGARYALKTLIEGVGDAELARFAREVEALGKLDHPNVVRVHAARLEGYPPYLVQDLLSGGTLAERLRAGPMPVEEAASIVAKVARGVQAAHDVGVLHRDIKPANVLFDDQGEPRILDFGLAKAVEVGTSELTKTGQVVGTPAYMAPEQIQNARTAGTSADVYALGGLLYALLTGGSPFSGGGMLVVLNRVLREAPAPPSRSNADVPKALEVVCLQAMAKAPTDRPASAQALADAIEESLRRPHAGRGPSLVLVGAATVLLALAGLALLSFSSGGEDLPSLATVLERSQTLKDDLQQAIDQGAYDRVPDLRAEVELLLQVDPDSALLQRQERRLTVLEALGHVMAGEPAAARALASRLPSEEREARDLDALISAIEPHTSPEEAVRLLSALRSLPQRHLLLAKAHAQLGDWRQVAGELDVYVRRGGDLAKPEQELRVRALLELGEPARAQEALASLDDAQPDLRWRVALNLLEQRFQQIDARLVAANAKTEPGADGVPGRVEAARATYGWVREVLVDLPSTGLEKERRKLAERLLEGHQACDPTQGNPTPEHYEAARQRLLLVDELTPNETYDHDRLASFLGDYTMGPSRPWGPEKCVFGNALLDVGGGDHVVRREVCLGLGSLAWPAAKDALKVVDRAVRAEDDAVQRLPLLVVRGKLLVAFNTQEHAKEADAALSEALEGAPREWLFRVSALHARAIARAQLKRYDDALADLDEAIGISPLETRLRSQRSILAVRAGRIEEGLPELREFLKLDDLAGTQDYDIALSMIWEHDRESRELMINAVGYMLKERPAPRPGWRSRRALLYCELGQWEKAASEMQVVARKFAEHPRASVRRLRRRCVQIRRKLRGGQEEDAKAQLVELVEELPVLQDELRQAAEDQAAAQKAGQ